MLSSVPTEIIYFGDIGEHKKYYDIIWSLKKNNEKRKRYINREKKSVLYKHTSEKDLSKKSQWDIFIGINIDRLTETLISSIFFGLNCFYDTQSSIILDLLTKHEIWRFLWELKTSEEKYLNTGKLDTIAGITKNLTLGLT